MANSRSALKRIRKTKRETSRNLALKSRVKSLRKQVTVAVEAGDKKRAEEVYNQFASAADKAAKKGSLHKKKASRLKSRVAAMIANAA